MKALPRSLAGQTVLVLLLGLTLSHLASMVTFSHQGDVALQALSSQGVVTRIVDMARLIDEAPGEWRPRLLNAASVPGIDVVVSDGLGNVSRAETAEEAALRGDIERRMGRGVHLRLIDPLIEKAHEHFGVSPETLPAGHLLQLGIPLQDGTWLNVNAQLPGRSSLWTINALISMVLMTAGVLVAAFWAVRRLTKPLRTFADAAERLGKDVQAPPLLVTGPTELQQATEAFNQMQERLRRLIENRLQMVAAISHDLRTPITLLRLRAEFVEDAEERTKMLATLEEMEALIASVLGFAREEATAEPSKVVDLSALLGSICDDLVDAGASVECAAPTRLPYECRPLALKRAFTNLIQNAVKYGTRASVAMSCTPNSVFVSVDDDGPGIPEEELALVFAPFYRIDKSRCRETGGVGLGLSVAQSIIHAHGGRIQLANRASGGLRVAIELPR